MYFFVFELSCYLLSCSTYSQVELFYQKDEQESFPHVRARIKERENNYIYTTVKEYIYIFTCDKKQSLLR